MSQARLRGVAFDLDGTLIDNMGFHAEAWLNLAHELRVPLSAERFHREFAGRKNEEIFASLLGRELRPSEVRELSDRKELEYRRLYEPKLTLIAGADAWFDELEGAGIPVALATAAPADNRAMVFRALDLARRFRFIVGPEDVRRGKPHPDLFLAAARGLALPPTSCLAFEDAVNGVVAARAAGMQVAAITTTESGGALLAAGALVTLDDYTDVPLVCRELLGMSA